jgi:RIO-like serine/threonine protein kinase
MTPDHELLDTIEEIRKQKFADVPAELLEQIATIERNFMDNRQEAYKRIVQAIDAHLASQNSGKKAGV